MPGRLCRIVHSESGAGVLYTGLMVFGRLTDVDEHTTAVRVLGVRIRVFAHETLIQGLSKHGMMSDKPVPQQPHHRQGQYSAIWTDCDAGIRSQVCGWLLSCLLLLLAGTIAAQTSPSVVDEVPTRERAAEMAAQVDYRFPFTQASIRHLLIQRAIIAIERNAGNEQWSITDQWLEWQLALNSELARLVPDAGGFSGLPVDYSDAVDDVVTVQIGLTGYHLWPAFDNDQLSAELLLMITGDIAASPLSRTQMRTLLSWRTGTDRRSGTSSCFSCRPTRN